MHCSPKIIVNALKDGAVEVVLLGITIPCRLLLKGFEVKYIFCEFCLEVEGHIFSFLACSFLAF